MILYGKIQKNIRCLLILSFYNLVNSLNLIDESLEPKPGIKVFKIMDTNNKVWLQKDSSQYNPLNVKKFLKDNADVEIRMKNILKQFEPAKYPKGAQKVLVKRIIPHDQDTPDLEFDRERNVFFRPLIRYHVTKKVAVDDYGKELGKTRGNYIALNELEDSNKKDKLLDILANRYENQENLEKDMAKSRNDRALLEIFGMTSTKKTESESAISHAVSSAIKLLKDIKLLSKRAKSPLTKLYVQKRLLKILKKTYELFIQLLRPYEENYSLSSETNLLANLESELYNKDVPKEEVLIVLLQKIQLLAKMTITEEKDQVTRKLAVIQNEVYILYKKLLDVLMGLRSVDDKDLSGEKRNVTFSMDPLFNYWTYKKTLYLDSCPGQQVKLGNVCTWIPPH